MSTAVNDGEQRGASHLAVLLRAPSDWISERTGVPPKLALAAVVLALVGGIALAIWLVAPRLLRETDALVRSLPALTGNLEALLTRYSWGEWFVAQTPPMSALLPSPDGIVTRLTGIVFTGLDVPSAWSVSRSAHAASG